MGSYHGCGGGLGCHGSVIDLLLTGFDFCLQVCRRVKILALLPGAAALNVVHANSDSVICGVNHGAVTGVSEAAICLPSRTVSPLKLATHLRGDIIKDSDTGSACSQTMSTTKLLLYLLMFDHSLGCKNTSSLSVRCSFCEGEEEDEEEEELWTVTGGLPETRTWLLERLSVEMRLIPWLSGVMYEP